MFKLFEKYPDLVAAVSERSDGSMKIFADRSESPQVVINRKKFLEKNGIPFSTTVAACLCHGKSIRKISTKDKGLLVEDIDGLITKDNGIFLSVTVADCLPIFLFDCKENIVSIVHAGWKGLADGIIAEDIMKLKNELGCRVENILVGIGPSIGRCHYEVGKDLAEKFERHGQKVKREESGKIFLDLKKIAELQLIENGILEKNIETNSECTFCEKEKYFSFRRDAGGDLKKLEAMLAVIGMRK